VRIFKLNSGDFNYVGKHDVTSKETLKQVYFSYGLFSPSYPKNELKKYLKQNDNKLKYGRTNINKNITLGKEYQVANLDSDIIVGEAYGEKQIYVRILLDNGVTDEIPLDDFEHKKMEIKILVNDYYPTRINLNLLSTKILMINNDGYIDIFK